MCAPPCRAHQCLAASGWTDDDGVARVRDIELAERLGYGRPRDIRPPVAPASALGQNEAPARLASPGA